jgi:hypothetical protein
MAVTVPKIQGMKNKHPHTNTENTLFGTLEPTVSVVDFKAKKSLKISKE